MSEITTVGLDLAKNVFHVHGADGSGRAVLRKKLRRGQVLAFFQAVTALRRGDGSLRRRPFLGPRFSMTVAAWHKARLRFTSLALVMLPETSRSPD